MTAPSGTLLASWAADVHQPIGKVEIQWDGTNWLDETGYLIEVGGVLSINPETRFPEADEATITLSNDTGRYSAEDDDGPLYPYLTKGGQKVRITLGYDGESITVGTFWIGAMTPSASARKVTFRLHDRISQLRKVKVTIPVDAGINTADAFRDLCDAAGLVENTDYTVETGETTCLFVGVKDGDLITELSRVAQAEGGRFFADEDGILRFWNRSHHRSARSSALWTVVRSRDAYEVTYKRRDPKAVNRVLLKAEQRVYQASAIVCSAQVFCQLIGVASDGYVYTTGAEQTVTLEAQDPYTFETGSKVEFTTISTISGHVFSGTWNATTRRPNVGAAVTMQSGAPPASVLPSEKVYYTWTPDGSKGELKLWYVGTAAAYVVVDVEINGKPWRVYPPWAARADDATAQSEAGLVVPLEMDNSYIGMDGGTIAADILLTRMGAIASVDLPDLDGMPWARPYDTFDFTDDSVSPVLHYRLSLIRHEWKWGEGGSLSSSLITAPVSTTSTDPDPILLTWSMQAFGSPAKRADDADPPWYWAATDGIAWPKGYEDGILSTEGLAEYWPMNEASSPLYGNWNGNDLTVTGSPSYQQAGLFEDDAYSILWTRAPDSYAVSSGDATWFGTGNMSLELWFKMPTFGGYYRPLAGVRDWTLNTNCFYMCGLNGSDVIECRYTSSDSTNYTINVPFTPDTVTHLVMTWDGSYLRVYKDGVLYGSPLSATKTHGVPTDPFAVNRTLTANYTGAGYISDVSCWEVALTADQVAQHYATGRMERGLDLVWDYTEWS